MKKYLAIALFLCCFFMSLYTATASGSIKLNDVLMETVLSEEEKSEVFKVDSLYTTSDNLIDYQQIRSSVETTLLELHSSVRRAVSACFRRIAVLFWFSISLLDSIYHLEASRMKMSPPAHLSQKHLIIKSTKLQN